MSPWTAFLESLHSALLDELIERHPEPKPELGLPMRKSQFALPEPSATAIVLCEVEQADKSRGIGCIAMNSGCSNTLGIGPKALWDACMKRAGADFARREIRPRISQVVEVKNTIPLPKGFPEPTRVIWIPVRFPSGSCYFGMGA